jgi:hypothetical protein
MFHPRCPRRETAQSPIMNPNKKTFVPESPMTDELALLPPDRLLLRLLVDVPTFGQAAIERFAPDEQGAVVKLRADEDQWV